MQLGFVFLCFIALVLSASAHEGDSSHLIKFDDLPTLVREMNDNVQAAHLTLKAEKKRKGYLIRSFLPQLALDYGGEQFKGGTDTLKRQPYWKVEAQLNLYRGGRDRLENSVRNLNVEIARTSYSSEYQQELKEARQNYWRLISVANLLKDKKEAIERNEQNINKAKKRLGSGSATSADIVQFELKRTLLNQDLKQLQIQGDLLKNELSVAVGLDRHRDLQVEPEFTHPKEELDVKELAPNQALDVQILNQKELVMDLKRKESSRWWHPRIDLYSNYGLPALSEDYVGALEKENEWAAGIRISLNLGDGFESYSEASARKFEVYALKKRTAQKERELVAMDHELRHDLNILHNLLHDTENDVVNAEKFLKLTEEEYRKGVKNGPDLLMAFQQLYDFRQRRVDLYRNYYEVHAELMALLAKDEAV